MALRRLLSGWLIAVATLARSMALVLERAAADRSEPTPNPIPGPVMAALAERYPGAPDHWLALVAERTSRLAEAGEAPLSLSSQASTWPESLPGVAGPLAALTPAASSAGEARSVEPPRPIAHASPPSSSQRDGVPSLAALRERSSEVWCRPQASQGRRSRPVFAPGEPTSPPIGPRLESDARAQRRPRSPLTMEDRTSFTPAVDAPPSVVSPSKIRTQDAWSEGRPPGAETSSERPVAASSTAQKSVSRAESHSRWARAPSATSSASFGETSGASSPVRDTLTFQPPVDRGARGAPSPLIDRGGVHDGPAAERPHSSSPTRPTPRRAIFRMLAGLGARSRAAWGRPHVAPADSTARSSAPGPDLQQITRRSTPLAIAPSAVASDEDEPSIRARPPVAVPTTSRKPGPTQSRAFAAEDFANDETPPDPRARVAISHPSTHTGGPRTAPSSVDDRWPRFPPTVFTPPLAAEIPSPRLDQLAREQEEGRWSV